MRATPKGEKSCLWQVFSDDRRRLQSIGLNIEIALQTARTNSLWCTKSNLIRISKRIRVGLFFFLLNYNFEQNLLSIGRCAGVFADDCFKRFRI